VVLRYLNVLAIAALVGSALYAYSIKYETILFSEQIVKVQHSIEREQDRIAALRAEWAYITRPERLQALADKHLDMQQLGNNQIIISAADLPDQPPKVDTIGRKLESLGLSEPTSTPRDVKASGSAVTPSTRPR
jgi:cell division protein FtsL